ncbi:hypothetical protein KAFR_0B01000 [Kazachstania africana CBS 2517]|uniref:Nucleolar complex protein 14 n=1 Tax=Kazachstania africana (strain ATCC 22294 / BCRC 22015 / CBS 2517 / CECT 1963 / NBRC 1671 / NRRL Y-8276) TaxID=1071382 RepID=H2APU8_KAZAF|nr:hypothetical protein KAFR_0B01000 [Kazachstania africana CBS 2517]CCF56398.1 hypothetical protein KAFR_0B01000 [Kazachstania africana CBS 2517]
MAGSQLKNLKATLKAHGLTGQANVKKNKKNTKRQAKEYDREEKVKLINKIREQFNPFEVKTAKNKRNETGSKDNRIAVGKPGISKQIGEEERLRSFEARKLLKNRKGGLVDRRFGERNKNMTEEEKMLERFTRERQIQSKRKQSLFNLDEDDEDDQFDMQGNNLTHLGAPLNETEQDDFGLDEPFGKRGRFDDDDTLGELLPARKKTKAEVMKEVIAKSKFYKQERQKAQSKLEDQIDDLDENFDDIMSELMTTQTKKHTIEAKEQKDIDYDIKVRELLDEKRAAPADRTKTEEELQKEAEDNKKKLEQQRLDRMQGIFNTEDEEERGIEDLDDGFWENSEEEDEKAEDDIPDSDDDIKFGDEVKEIDREFALKIAKSLPCPSKHDDLLALLKNFPLSEHPKIIKKIINAYQPKLAEGNKERLGKFTAILLRHIMFLVLEDYEENLGEVQEVQTSLISILKTLSEKYNHALSDECRIIISEIQTNFKNSNFAGLNTGHLMFFILVGILFSTSDQYHLVITPSSILIGEFLEQIKFNTLTKIAFGAVLASISLQYQRISKRYIPELVYFIQKVLVTFIGTQNLIGLKSDTRDLALKDDISFTGKESDVLQLHKIFSADLDKDTSQKTILLHVLTSLERAMSQIWKEFSAFAEITNSFEILLSEYRNKYPSLEKVPSILNKIERLNKFNEHFPLTLQNHKPVSIPSHAPKFEENFNPDKKSYDPDATRNEINKMKAQLKKERKFTMKEIRKDTRFEARQRIDQKKKEHSEYHAKMAHIYNTITTEEGAEKNKYEREKALRRGKK